MRTLGLFTAATCAAVITSAWSPPCSAEGYALNRFDPAPAGDALFGVQAPTTAGHMQLYASLIGDYAYNPFTLTRRRGVADVGSVVEHQLFLHLNASFALWNHVTFGFDVPVAVAQGGADQVVDGEAINAPTGAQFGDVRLHARGTFYGERTDPFSIGLGAYLWVPSGASDAFVSDGSVRGSAQLLLGGQAESFYWNVATGPQFRESKTLIGVQQGTMYNWSVGLGVLLGEHKQVQLGPEASVSISVEDVARRNTNGELLLGAKYRFADYFTIGAAAGPGFTKGIGTPDVRALASFEVAPFAERRNQDADGDKVPDRADACPNRIGVASADPEKNGCPAPTPSPVAPTDSDSDGIADDLDACPGIGGVSSADPKMNGCPPDSDGDGLDDSKDACPKVALVAPAEAEPGKPGCPAPDDDADGVPNHRDACIAQAGPSTDDPKTSGCPADSDGDGIIDSLDACPNEKGIDDEDTAKRGCPHKVSLAGKQIVIAEQVQFETGRATIKKESDALLDEVAEVLKKHTEILTVEVAGHTDNVGGRALNTRLSKNRAEAVRKALIARGVDAGRLVAKGYGPDKPIADNDTDVGRAKNRRVQFVIVKQEPKGGAK